MSIVASPNAGLFSSLRPLADIGRDPIRGGYSRPLWSPAELELRGWFGARATSLGLTVTADRNSNLWAWWGDPAPQAVVTGSHLDSVPGGGAFDGPLGVVSAFDAIERLKTSGFVPSRSIAVVAFAEEEGSRFGLACLGSRLLTGDAAPDRVRLLADASGNTFESAARDLMDFDSSMIGRDDSAIERIGVYVELHVEQGRALVDLGQPVALATSILAHGRWSVSFTGEGNHAGATAMTDRHDPVVAAARAVLAVRDLAIAHPDARATVGRVDAVPGGTNVIASAAHLTLDVRDAEGESVRVLVDALEREFTRIAEDEGCTVAVREDSWSEAVEFDAELRGRLDAILGGVPHLPTGAGHDAGILASVSPTAMVFVRNPTGSSHAESEWADADDCEMGVSALTAILRELSEAS